MENYNTIGGYLGRDQVSVRVDVYDPQSDTWSLHDSLPYAISGNAFCTYENYIYAIGDYHFLDFLVKYDVINKKFTAYKSNLIKRRHAGATIIDETLYIFGGNQSSNISTSIKPVQYIKIDQFK